jgi:hypothetical protein
MAWWIELQCDARAAPTAYKQRCYSDVNNNVMGGFHNRSGEWGMKKLRARAREEGWKFKPKLGWVCPYCQTQPQAPSCR